LQQTPRAVTPTPLEWLLLAAGLVGVNHYAWVLDDAFVFFRYADNFALLDYGLVYNKGEFVEGFTSPLWTLLLSAVRVTGLDYWFIVRGFGAASFTLFWWLLVLLGRALSPAGAETARPPLFNFPMLYLAPNYAVLCYFTSGTEAPLVQLAAIAYALHIVQPERRLPAAVVGISTLIRPELALASAMAFLWTGITTRRFPWQLALPASLSVGGWLTLRIVYYAELLPNTFYLKDLSDWGQGLVYLNQTLATYHFYAVAAVFASLAILLQRRGANVRVAPRLMMWAIAVAISIYFIRVGGDTRHYRYLAFPFCLATASFAGLPQLALQTFTPRLLGPGFAGSRRARNAALATGLLLAAAVASLHPPQLARHPIHLAVKHRQIDKINDASYHRNHARLSFDPWSTVRIQPHTVTPMTTDDYAGIVNTGWCEWAYQTLNFYVIHNLGLTEPILARVDIPPDRPGHKSDLQTLALDLEEVHRAYTPGRGMYRLAAENGIAAPWIVENLETIEVIEQKIYNEHDLLENLKLSLRFPPRLKIRPGTVPDR
jgi:hypothetical protein